MRSGIVYKRCSKCGRTVKDKVCTYEPCQSKSYTWAYRVDLAPPGAHRKQRGKSGFKTKKEAEDRLHELLQAHKTGSVVDPHKLATGEYLDAWLETIRPEVSGLSEGAWDAHELHVRAYLKPRIGDVPLLALDELTIERMLADLAANGRKKGGGALNAKTVHNAYLSLHKALGAAVKKRLLPRNVSDGLHTWSPAQLPEHAVWTPEQLQRFYDHVRDDRLFACWRLLGATGMRRGEVLGLRWSDIDLERGVVAVVRQRRRGGGKVADSDRLKTRKSRRQIALDPVTIAILKEHRRRQLEEKLLLGPAYNDEDRVFCYEDGRGIDPSGLTQRLRARVKAAGLPWITLHGLRHTHITHGLRAGVPLKVMSERAGHSSVAVTGDVYSHVTPDLANDAAAKIAALVDG